MERVTSSSSCLCHCECLSFLLEDGLPELTHPRYLVDAFTAYAASALAANTVVRSIAGAVLPIAGLKMFSVLGVGWGNSLLGFIGLAMLPVPFYLLKKGEWLRTRFEIKNL